VKTLPKMINSIYKSESLTRHKCINEKIWIFLSNPYAIL